ncbi:hypothetical protein B0H13DRAFT_2280624 [Mycena leptocephala]|nr:hypothetical protein B0H13DRAFT_2280624 [Mycena leptocephala]
MLHTVLLHRIIPRQRRPVFFTVGPFVGSIRAAFVATSALAGPVDRSHSTETLALDTDFAPFGVECADGFGEDGECTLNECAARERIGGTFHSGTTNLGKDTCLCSLCTPPLFLLPPPPLAPTSPPTRQKSAKMTTDGTDQLFIDSDTVSCIQQVFLGCRDFTLDFNEASQNPDNVEKEAQPCSKSVHLQKFCPRAHIFRGATAGDHRESQVEARNFLPETSARSARF